MARESIEQANDAADRLSGTARTDLLDLAIDAFDVAARWGLALCMAILLLATAVVAVALRDVR